MVWWTRTLEITRFGKPLGKWRQVAVSDEGGGGPYGNSDCFHDTPQEAEECEKCAAFVDSVTGMPRMRDDRLDHARRLLAPFMVHGRLDPDADVERLVRVIARLYDNQD